MLALAHLRRSTVRECVNAALIVKGFFSIHSMWTHERFDQVIVGGKDADVESHVVASSIKDVSARQPIENANRMFVHVFLLKGGPDFVSRPQSPANACLSERPRPIS